MKLIQRIRDRFEAERVYFLRAKDEITLQNSRMLRAGCIVYALVLAVYTTLSFATDQPGQLKAMYCCFDAVHAVICAIVFLRPRRARPSYRATQVLGATFELSILAFFALEGALTSPVHYAMYVPIALLLVLLLFVHGTLYTLGITVLYLGVYLGISIACKVPEAWSGDVHIAFATLMASIIGYELISAMRRREAAALANFENLSCTDALTGLSNKMGITAACKRLLAMPGRPFVFIVLDLDNFKSVNDTYGHQVGDEVLASVGRVLRECFRDSDRVGRFGGDEFIVLMDGCDDVRVVESRLKLVGSSIAELQFCSGELTCACSMGVAARKESDAFDSVFKRADAALYRAKAQGKGTWCLDA